jgi:hypothetical protein
MVLDNGGKDIRCFSKKDNAKLWDQIGSINLSDKKFWSSNHCQVSIPKAFFRSIISEIESFSDNNMLLSLAIQAHAGTGVIDIFCGDWNEDKISTDLYRYQIESLRQIAQSHKGNMVIHQTLDSFREPELIWGNPGDDFHLMKTIKIRYDQHQVLVAGRFIGGL